MKLRQVGRNALAVAACVTALVVVSHDRRFLERIAPTRTIELRV